MLKNDVTIFINYSVFIGVQEVNIEKCMSQLFRVSIVLQDERT